MWMLWWRLNGRGWMVDEERDVDKWYIDGEVCSAAVVYYRLEWE